MCTSSSWPIADEIVLQHLRRYWRRSFGRPLQVYYHPTYRWPVPTGHLAPTMSPRRAQDALTWALHQGVVDRSEVVEPGELAFSTAELIHAPEYLGRLDEREVVASIVGTDPEQTAVAALLETWRRAAEGTVAAARWAIQTRGRAMNLLGGFHHAAPMRGAGFCALNDIAIAVAALRDDGIAGPIVVIDLDAHPPDGIVQSLRSDEALTVLSISVESEWAIDDSAATVVDRRLPAGTEDKPYLDAVFALLEELPERPRIAFYLAGADPLVGDPLGTLSVSEFGLRLRDRRVLRALGDVPTVMLPGGGYLLGSWRVHAGTLAEAARVTRLVAPGYDPVHRRTKEIGRALDPEMLNNHDDDVFITEEELMGGLVAAPRPTPRVLGFYSRHGVEYALNAYGYWPLLERMGFRDLALELSHHQGSDHLRVTAQVNGSRAPLFDLVARRRAIEGFSTLFVDWLELQDPRVTFSPNRPRLPGQQRPGLGLGDETIQLLVQAGRRLGLDGVAFVPAYYHVGWMARGHFVFLDPEIRGRFQALIEVLHDVPLVEASTVLDGEGWPLRGADGEPDGDVVRWTPSEMMIPISDVARQALKAADLKATEAREAMLERLLPSSARR